MLAKLIVAVILQHMCVCVCVYIYIYIYIYAASLRDIVGSVPDH